jgi:integrase
MQGHIRKRGKRSWAVVLSLGRDPVTGKKKQKWLGGFRSRREAQAKRAQVLVDWHSGGWVEPTKMTTGEFLLKWLQDYAAGLGAATAVGYTGIVRRSLIPSLGHIPLARLCPQDIQGYYSQMLQRDVRGRLPGRKVRASTVRSHHRLLRTALGHAVRWGLIARNPATLVNPPKVERRHPDIWDPERVRLFLGEAKRRSRYHALYLTAILTGMRQGELLGLRWQDVNLVQKTATIRQTLCRLGGRVVQKTPKTAGSARTVTLPDAVVDALQAIQADQQRARAILGDAYAASLDLVFCQPNGQPLHAKNLTQRDFRRVVRAAGLPPIRFHDLRHAHASYLAMAGVPLKVAQERLGHATPTFTAAVYQHVLGGQQEAAARDVEALLLGRAEPEAHPDGGRGLPDAAGG